jgi:NAD(P)-dependent dehydrogenase (short-subunit alcohol dehydrogenase family)
LSSVHTQVLVSSACVDCASCPEDAVIADGIINISDYAFWRCTTLRSITIPSSVKSIHHCAFCFATGLTAVTLNEGLASIGESAFFGCSALLSITIPSSVTTIDSFAFCIATGLTAVSLNEGLTSIGERAFYRCQSLYDITIPSSVATIGSHAFSEASDLTRVTFSEGVTAIGEYAFADSPVAIVTFPVSLQSLGQFSFCPSHLSHVTLYEGVSFVGRHSFCSSVVDVQDDKCGDKIVRGLKGRKVDILINNAGYFTEKEERLDALDFSEEKKMIDVCAIGPLRVTSALFKAGLLAKHAKVIMITSQAGSISWRLTQNPEGHDYGHHMSKAASTMASVLLSQELKQAGIAVGIFHPGFNKTEMTTKYKHKWEEEGAVDPAVGAKRVCHEICRLDMKTTGRFINCEDGLEIPF